MDWDDRLIVGEDTSNKRLLDKEHGIIDKTENGTTFSVRCKCGWKMSTLIAFKEECERGAWMHISKPHLLIAGSSDIERSSRLDRALRVPPSEALAEYLNTLPQRHRMRRMLAQRPDKR